MLTWSANIANIILPIVRAMPNYEHTKILDKKFKKFKDVVINLSKKYLDDRILQNC